MLSLFTPDFMILQTGPEFPLPRANRTGIAQEAVNTNPMKDTSFPERDAALGPDYDIGKPYYPAWVPNKLMAEHLIFIGANYGQAGSQRKDANNSTSGDPLIAGKTEFDNAKVRTIRWDPDFLPGFDPRIQQWNNLPNGSYYRGRIPPVKSNADFNNSVQEAVIQSPLNYTPPNVASLVASGLAGS